MDFINFAQIFFEHYGLVSIFFIVMLEYANFPLPSEIVLPFLGIMIAQGHINFISALLVSILGGVVGSLTNYFIGLYFGKPIIDYIAKKYSKFNKSIDSSMACIDKYGKLSVMIARVIPLARTVISIPAGITKMNLLSFIFYSSIGILAWNTFLISLGYVLGDNLKSISYFIKNYSIAIVVILITAALVYLIKAKYNNRLNNKNKLNNKKIN